MKLENDKHERFCQEYIIDLNATEAAKRAKYSKKTARVQASQLLTILNIQKRIAELKKERSERTKITQDMVITELAICGFSDLKDYIEVIEDTGVIRAKSFEEMPEGKSRALQSIKEDRVIKEDAKGEQVTVYDKINFKLYNKIQALELIGKHLGMFTENLKISGEIKHKLSMADLKKSLKDYKENGS